MCNIFTAHLKSNMINQSHVESNDDQQTKTVTENLLAQHSRQARRSPQVWSLEQPFSTLVLGTPYPARLKCFPLPTHLVEMNGVVIKLSRILTTTDSFESGASEEGTIENMQDSGSQGRGLGTAVLEACWG